MATIREKILNVYNDKSDKRDKYDVKFLLDLLNSRGVPTNTTDEGLPIDTPRLIFNKPYDRGQIVIAPTMVAFNRKNYWFDVYYMPDVYLRLKAINALSLKGYKVWYRLYKEKGGH